MLDIYNYVYDLYILFNELCLFGKYITHARRMFYAWKFTLIDNFLWRIPTPFVVSYLGESFSVPSKYSFFYQVCNCPSGGILNRHIVYLLTSITYLVNMSTYSCSVSFFLSWAELSTTTFFVGVYILWSGILNHYIVSSKCLCNCLLGSWTRS